MALFDGFIGGLKQFGNDFGSLFMSDDKSGNSAIKKAAAQAATKPADGPGFMDSVGSFYKENPVLSNMALGALKSYGDAVGRDESAEYEVMKTRLSPYLNSGPGNIDRLYENSPADYLMQGALAGAAQKQQYERDKRYDKFLDKLTGKSSPFVKEGETKTEPEQFDPVSSPISATYAPAMQRDVSNATEDLFTKKLSDAELAAMVPGLNNLRNVASDTQKMIDANTLYSPRHGTVASKPTPSQIEDYRLKAEMANAPQYLFMKPGM